MTFGRNFRKARAADHGKHVRSSKSVALREPQRLMEANADLNLWTCLGVNGGRQKVQPRLRLVAAIAITSAISSTTVALSPQPLTPRLDFRFGEGAYSVSVSDRQRLKTLEAAAVNLNKTAFLVSVLASEEKIRIGMAREDVIVECLQADGISLNHIFVEILSTERKRAFWEKVSKLSPQFRNEVPDTQAGRADVVTVFVSPNDPPLRSSGSVGGWD